jgi:hypothetical protein
VPSQRDRERWDRDQALRLADIAREQGLDLVLAWDEVVERFNGEQKVLGQWPLGRAQAERLLPMAVAQRDALCPHGLGREQCAGPERHHVG